MIEKMNIFDVEIPILTAKEAMIRAMQYLESESVDTIELVSMDMLMKEKRKCTMERADQCTDDAAAGEYRDPESGRDRK